jgi:hypothetical protein
MGKVIQEQRERVREQQREDKTVDGRRMGGMSPSLQYVVTANTIKVF